MSNRKYPPESIIIIVILAAIILYFWREVLGFIFSFIVGIFNLIRAIVTDIVEFAIFIGVILLIVKLISLLRKK